MKLWAANVNRKVLVFELRVECLIGEGRVALLIHLFQKFLLSLLARKLAVAQIALRNNLELFFRFWKASPFFWLQSWELFGSHRRSRTVFWSFFKVILSRRMVQMMGLHRRVVYVRNVWIVRWVEIIIVAPRLTNDRMRWKHIWNRRLQQVRRLRRLSLRRLNVLYRNHLWFASLAELFWLRWPLFENLIVLGLYSWGVARFRMSHYHFLFGEYLFTDLNRLWIKPKIDVFLAKL